MRNQVVKHFDSIFELVEDMQALFSDRLSDPSALATRMVEALERKSSEIDDKTLP